MISKQELQGILEAHGFIYTGPDGPKWLGQAHALLRRKLPYSCREGHITWVSFSDGSHGEDHHSLRANDLQRNTGLLGPREDLPKLLLEVRPDTRRAAVYRALIEAQLRYR